MADHEQTNMADSSSTECQDLQQQHDTQLLPSPSHGSESAEVQGLRDQADQLAESGDLAGALASFQAALLLAPAAAGLHEAAAQLLNELGRPAEALAVALAAARLAPAWPQAHATLAHAARNAGLLDAAAAALRSALHLLGPNPHPDAEEMKTELAEVMALQEEQVARDVGLPQLLVSQQPWSDADAAEGPSPGPSVKVWEASVVLAGVLAGVEAVRAVLRGGGAVLELGAGAGVAGLAAALLGGRVVLTELPAALPALRRNVERLRPAIRAAAAAATAAAAAFDFSDASAPLPLAELLPPPLALVLGADLVYAAHQAAPLAAALARLARGHPAAALLLAHKHRSDAVDEALLRALALNRLAISERLRAAPPPGPAPPPPHASHSPEAAGPQGQGTESEPVEQLVSPPSSSSGVHSSDPHPPSTRRHLFAAVAQVAGEERLQALLAKFPSVSVFSLTYLGAEEPAGDGPGTADS